LGHMVPAPKLPNRAPAARAYASQHPIRPICSPPTEERAHGRARGMATRTIFDKSKLPSRHATVGPDRAPNRSYYFAMGLRREEIEAPFVGVVTTWNEAAPCNIALARQAQAAK